MICFYCIIYLLVITNYLNMYPFITFLFLYAEFIVKEIIPRIEGQRFGEMIFECIQALIIRSIASLVIGFGLAIIHPFGIIVVPIWLYYNYSV